MLQYLKHVRPYRDIAIFERFPVLICIIIIWIYSVILTASGAYQHRPKLTQHSCRTDKANLISTAPWYTTLPFFSLICFKFCWILRFHCNPIGSCSHILSNGAPLHSMLAMHSLQCLLLLFQWWRYIFSFLKFLSYFVILAKMGIWIQIREINWMCMGSIQCGTCISSRAYARVYLSSKLRRSNLLIYQG